MVETVQRKRIEILADTPLVPRVVAVLKAADISGWSLIHVDGGAGRGGAWQDDDITGASAKTIIIAIASAARAELLTERIAPLLDSHRLLLTIGDVAVVRGDRF
jgi:Kef-type K+ transport system membrane component KefB